MNRLSSVLAIAIVLCMCFAGGADAQKVIRSWDDATQRGLDLNTGGPGVIGYGQMKADILARGHTVLPGITTITLANLAGVNVFFHGATTHLLTGAEQSALDLFVRAGGCLIIEANSSSLEQASANSSLSGLGLGNPYNGATGGANDATAGLYSNNITTTTVGPLGDLRNLRFGSSLSADITPTGGTVVGMNDATTCMVEYVVGSGRVLACGDPYGFNLFMSAAESLYNANNSKAYLNFIEKDTGPVGVEAGTWARVKSLYR